MLVLSSGDITSFPCPVPDGVVRVTPRDESQAEAGLSRRGVLHLLGLAGAGGLALAGYQASQAHAVFWVHPLNPRGHITRDYPFPSSIYNGGYHHALDYVSDGSLAVHAVASGTVQATDVASSGAGWGNYVLINHGESYWSSLALARRAPGNSRTERVSGSDDWHDRRDR